MLARPEPACLVIADISGYTGYLAGVELDHAQDILADLVSTVVGALRPTFRLAKLEGDAAFVYVLTDRIDGSQLQDTVERCYFAFRRRLRDIARASTCECNACIRIPNLNLKLLAHHGEVGRQRMAGREELVGSAVIVVHRMLKNAVADELGLAAYAMYTQACIDAMGADAREVGLVEHRESYEGVGEVVGWVRDLEAAWRDEEERARVLVGREGAAMVVDHVLPGPPAVVWEWVTSPARRPLWQAGVTGVEEAAPNGRRGVGTTNHCLHGRDAVIEEILDWRPFEYVTNRSQMPIPGAPKILMSTVLEPVPGGTRVSTRVARPRPKDRPFVESMRPMFEGLYAASHAALIPLIEEDVRRRAATADAEPALPAGI
ncbi:MAG TPA: DUF2652 domain-containing protein [Candidatus Limnocylindrales bacterium]|nr:DUF2652 domain-containing protein [Candidatus Limnocylindrales bacterium]